MDNQCDDDHCSPTLQPIGLQLRLQLIGGSATEACNVHAPRVDRSLSARDINLTRRRQERSSSLIFLRIPTQLPQEGRGILASFDHFHQRGADDHAIDIRRKALHLLRAANAEAGAQRQP